MPRAGAMGLAAAASVVAFAAAVFFRMNAEYGPLNLSLDPATWWLLLELLRGGQIAPRVVLQGALLGAAAAAAPWIVLAVLVRRR